MEHTSNENIAEALKLLEEAAKQKKDELRAVISDKYTHLRNLIVETESNLMTSLTTAKDHALETAAQARKAGLEKAREIGHDVDRSVHQNPWAYIAGTAVAGALFGYMLGRSRK